MYKIASTIFILSATFATTFNLYAQIPDFNSQTYEIKLPAALDRDVSDNYVSADAENWKAFERRYDREIFVDKVLGYPHRSIGKPIKIRGFDRVDETNLVAAAERFLEDNNRYFNLDLENIELRSANFVHGKGYVSFYLTLDGLKVLLSEIELRIFENGNVVVFGMDYYRDIDLNLTPKISSAEAVRRASEGISKTKYKTESALASDELFVLPIRSENSVDFKLVYKCEVRVAEPFAVYETFVDAESGAPVWRRDVVNRAAKARSFGTVKIDDPREYPVEKNFEYQYVDVNGERYLTDENGEFDVEVDSDAEVKATFEGTYAKIICENREDAKFEKTFSAGEKIDIDWDDFVSHRYERNMFYHLNKARELIKEIDPNFTATDVQMVCRLMFEGQSANAYSKMDSITFLACGSTEYRMADGASVLLHEYGHSATNLFYEQQGAERLNHGASHEAFADLNSALNIQDPRIGVGYKVSDPDYFIRNLENSKRYPDDIVNQSHADGEILGGAFWDLTELTSLDYVKRAVHFIKYSLADDENTGVIFSEWLLETLFYDDDNGDLTDGTPHFNQIIEAFDNHNIGVNLLYAQGFEHEPLADNLDYDYPFPTGFDINYYGIAAIAPESAKLQYRRRGEDFSFQEADATKIEDNSFAVTIPAPSAPTYIEYFFETEAADDSKTTLGADEYARPFGFLAGYFKALEDDLESPETQSNWTVGYDTDDAENGLWEYGSPTNLYNLTPGAAPETDNSPGGENCFGTAINFNLAESGGNFSKSLPNGATSLLSPVYDLSEYEMPVARFYRFNFVWGYQDYKAGTFIVYASTDGVNWQEALTFEDITPNWTRERIFIDELFPGAEQIQFRFAVEANSSQYGSYIRAFVDDLQIYSADVLNAVSDKNDQTYGLDVYPNPFSAETRIFNSQTEPANIKIFNSFGSLVFETQAREGSEVVWDGKDFSGAELASGTYAVTVETPTKTLSKIVILIR